MYVFYPGTKWSKVDLGNHGLGLNISSTCLSLCMCVGLCVYECMYVLACVNVCAKVIMCHVKVTGKSQVSSTLFHIGSLGVYSRVFPWPVSFWK